MRQRKIKILMILIALVGLTAFIDWKYWAQSRVYNHIWESHGAIDFANTGIDLIDHKKFEFSGDTLCFQNGTKLLFRHCILGSLWLSDIDKNYTARYIEFKGSKRW